jgi:hypothetical protein
MLLTLGKMLRCPSTAESTCSHLQKKKYKRNSSPPTSDSKEYNDQCPDMQAGISTSKRRMGLFAQYKIIAT